MRKGRKRIRRKENTKEDERWITEITGYTQITNGSIRFIDKRCPSRSGEYQNEITKKGKKKLDYVLKKGLWKNIPLVEIKEFKKNTGSKVIKKCGLTDKEIAIYIAHTRRMNKICGNCGRAEYCDCCNDKKGKVNLKRCGKCMLTYYCNDKCQRKDWITRHKYWCCKKDSKISLMFKSLGVKYDDETKIFKIVQLMYY